MTALCVCFLRLYGLVCDVNSAASSVRPVFLLERFFSGSVYFSRALASASLQLTDICHPLPVAQRPDQSQADRKLESRCCRLTRMSNRHQLGFFPRFLCYERY